jgi:hypothetical protein
MEYLARLSWGVVIYAIMFLLWNIFVLYGFVGGIYPRALGMLVLVTLALIAGRAILFASWRDILPYSVGWMVIAGIFDSIVSVPYTGWSIFLDWNLWVGYALIVCVPLFAPLSHRSAPPSALGHYGA